MPSIHLTNGLLKYRTIPIYEGVKRIDKEVAFENLCLLKQVLDNNSVHFQLAYGTLLGAVREQDFISHDEDVDLFILGENRQLFFDTLPALIEKGFKVARYDRRNLLSIIRKGEYIDFYIFDKYVKEGDELRICSGVVFPAYFFEETTMLNFKGVAFPVPKDYLGFLRCTYGKDWRIPKQYFNYELSPSKRIIHRIKEIVKDWLPDSVFLKLAARSESELFERTMKRIEKWREDMASGTE